MTDPTDTHRTLGQHGDDIAELKSILEQKIDDDAQAAYSDAEASLAYRHSVRDRLDYLSTGFRVTDVRLQNQDQALADIKAHLLRQDEKLDAINGLVSLARGGLGGLIKLGTLMGAGAGVWKILTLSGLNFWRHR